MPNDISPIFLDHHATTPCDPRVVDAMLPFFTLHSGNPSSTHRHGIAAHDAVERARQQVADMIGARPGEIVFTSGATEAVNLAFKGLALTGPIATLPTEHKAVLVAAASVSQQFDGMLTIGTDPEGLVDFESLTTTIEAGAGLVAIMLANNEIGVIQPISAVVKSVSKAGIPVFSDATQAPAWLPVDVSDLGVDLLALSAHKLYGPKGVGALYVRRRGRAARLRPLIEGGGQERGRRAGTSNVPTIVGFGEACRIAVLERGDHATRVTELRDQLLARLQAAIPDIVINGSMAKRLPNNLNISIPGVEADALLTRMPELIVSTGSACNSGVDQPSHVVLALGRNVDLAWGTLRFGLGRATTLAEIERAATLVITGVSQVRRQVT